MDHYADYWTGLILFLHRISTDSDCMSLRDELLGSNQPIRRHLKRTWAAVSRLHAANTDSVTFADCLDPSRISDSEGGNSDSDTSMQSSLKGLAYSMLTATEKLSVLLVRHSYGGLPFSSGVVAYCAMRTITVDNTWIGAHRYSPFLSGMIHCI